LEERNLRTDNSPEALFGEQLRAAQYLNHHYGIPIIGWRHEMEELGLEDAQAWYDRYYAPDNAILIVAGDVSPDAVRELAEEFYGPIPPSDNPPDARPQEPRQLARRHLEMSDPRVGQPYMTRSYLVEAYDPDEPQESAALSVLARIMGGGLGSRLAKSLEVEQKIAISTGAWYSAQSRDATTFTLYGVPAEGVELAEIEAAIDTELARMVESGPDEEELERAKQVVRADHIFAEDSQFGLARAYGAALSIGLSVADVENWPKVIDSVTADQVRAAAAGLAVERSVTGFLTGTGGEE